MHPPTNKSTADNFRARAVRIIVTMLVTVFASVAVAGAVGTNTAHAVGSPICGSYGVHKEFGTPGSNTDLWIDVCVYSYGPKSHYAEFNVSWRDGGDSAADGKRKFDKLRLNVRLERYDKVKVTDSCSIAGKVNRHRTGIAFCATDFYTSTAHNGWTADGTVTYDLDRDGVGSSTWSLPGSPQVY